MARTNIKVRYSCGFEAAESKVIRILVQNGFKLTTIKSGEDVWKKGVGIMTAMQYIKVEFSSDEVILSAWVQAGVGSVGGSEMDLTGFVAALPKKQLLKVLEEIKQAF
ncbi:MAG: hypothetical protein ACI3VN_04180 [Candidatus Onthomonas sp.]